MRHVLVLLLFLVAAGCVSVPRPATPFPEHPGRVAVTTTDNLPKLEFRGIAESTGEGAAIGGGATLLGCLGAMAPATCAGPFCGPMLVLWVGVCGVAGTAGGVVGAVATPSAREQKKSSSRLQSALAARGIQETLRVRVAEAAAARHVDIVDPFAGNDTTGDDNASPGASALSISTMSIGTTNVGAVKADSEFVLEVALTDIGARGHGLSSPLQAFMTAHVRLLRTTDHAAITAFDLDWEGATRKRADWLVDNGQPLVAELEHGYREMAAAIADRAFLLYPVPDRKPHANGTLSAVFGLAALAPTTPTVLTGDRLLGPSIEWKTADSLQPLLNWQEFPRDVDLAAAPQDMARVRNVRYDVVIARARDYMPAEIVYRREGITGNTHRLEQPLEAGERYFWSVRARFEFDGRERVTEWSDLQYGRFGKFAAPSSTSFRFRTPD